MTQFKKTKLAAAVLAASVAAPASAATWSAGDWEVSYSGIVNMFYSMADNNATGGSDSVHMQEGLLPAVHTMKAVSPATNGLTGTAQISMMPDTTTSKTQRLNKGGNMLDIREVFFNVDGSFGTVSVGRGLSLFQRNAIVKDMTLFGVGAAAGGDGGGTTLGRIGHGYVYPDFRSRFAWKSPDMGGMSIELGVFDPQEPGSALAGSGTTAFESDTPQIQGELTYSTAFDGGSVGVWAGFIWQEIEGTAVTGSGTAGQLLTTPTTGDITSSGINIGVDVSMANVGIVGSWYTGEALGTTFFLNSALGVTPFSCNTTACSEADNDGYYIQGTYSFGATKLGVSYGESVQDADAGSATGAIASREQQLFTIGLYHDVNSWLKLVAEYNSDNSAIANQDAVSVGGFMFW